MANQRIVGPWINGLGVEGDIVWIGPSRHSIVATCDLFKPREIVDLITAAPKLMAACQAALDAANELAISGSNFPRAQLKAAIAEAKGLT